MDANTAAQRFAAALAGAAVDFVVTEEPQEVYFDRTTLTFGHGPVEPGTAPDDVALYVADGWQLMIGHVDAVIDRNAELFSAELLRLAIINALKASADLEERALAVMRGDDHLKQMN